MKGRKTGGRTAGTPNKDRAELFAEVEALHPGFNPILALIDLAKRTKNEAIEATCLKEVAKYTLPQLRSVEIVEAEDKEVKIVVSYLDENGKESDVNPYETAYEKERRLREQTK